MQNFDFLSIWPLTPSHVDANCGVEQRHEDQVLVPEGVSQFGDLGAEVLVHLSDLPVKPHGQVYSSSK